MTYSEALKTGVRILKDANIEAPTTDAGALLCAAAGCDRVFLFAHGDAEMDESRLKDYLTMLDRRALGCPLQYLTGMQEFMSLSFEVGPGVLIPRQETELLVETVIRFCEDTAPLPEGQAECKAEGQADEGGISAPGQPTPPRILDIGTGSGCIAISLAHYIAGCRVTAVDKMEAALAIAKRNAVKNGVEGRIEFIQGDLFRNVPEERYDVIVSNPPYIRKGDIPGLMREVRDHEPIAALDGGEDGLDFYRRIIGKAPSYLKRGGLLAFETGYDQAAAVASLMSAGLVHIKILQDLSGIDRVVTGVFAGCPSLYTKSIS